MTVPVVTEIPPRLESVTHDDFIDAVAPPPVPATVLTTQRARRSGETL